MGIPRKVQEVIDELGVRYRTDSDGQKTRVYINDDYAGFINARGYDEKHNYTEIISRIRRVVRQQRGQPATNNLGDLIKSTSKETVMNKPTEPAELLLLRQLVEGQKTLISKMETIATGIELLLDSSDRKSSPRGFARQCILELMKDGVSRHIHEIHREIARKEPQLTEQQIGQQCSTLANNDELARLRTGVYVMENKDA